MNDERTEQAWEPEGRVDNEGVEPEIAEVVGSVGSRHPFMQVFPLPRLTTTKFPDR